MARLAWAMVAAWPAAADYRRGIAAYGSGDYAAAARDFAADARAGDVRAQSMLARLYAMGLGVPADLIQAWHWSNLAAQGGDREANALRVTLEGILTPAQLAQARATVPPGPPLPPVDVTEVGTFPPPSQQQATVPQGR